MVQIVVGRRMEWQRKLSTTTVGNQMTSHLTNKTRTDYSSKMDWESNSMARSNWLEPTCIGSQVWVIGNCSASNSNLVSSKLQELGMKFLDDCTSEGAKLAWMSHDTGQVLTPSMGSFEMGNFDMMVEMIRVGLSILHHLLGRIAMRLVSKGKLDELVQLVVAMIEEYSKRHLREILRDKIVDGISPYCWDLDDPFPENVAVKSKCEKNVRKRR